MEKKRSNKVNVYVLIEINKLGHFTDTPEVYGSLKELVTANIEDKGEILNYQALRRRLSTDSLIHYWKNDRYIIKKCVVKRAPKKANKKSK